MLRVIAHRTPEIEVFILAGGLSTRMGHDKARLRIDGKSMLAHIREAAAETRLGVRVIRRDSVPRCGPLGGIITGFRRSRADALLFLACDMPFVTAALLRRIVRASRKGTRAVFSSAEGRVGFPFLIPRAALALIEQQRECGEYSLQRLATRLEAASVRVRSKVVFNINTPADLESAQRLRRDTRSSRNRNPQS